MQIHVNDKTYDVQSEGDMPLLWVIRDELGLTGTKYGCGLAQCGACSVMVDGVVTRSCVIPVEGMVGRKISTIEAIEDDEIGKRVVAVWVKHQVPQCGYCQSGQVMAATALLKQIAHPTDEQIAAAMVNLCRCGTYNAIREAVHELAGGASSNTAATGNAVSAAEHPAPTVAVTATTALAGIAVVSAIAKAKCEKVDDGSDSA